jgi:phage major head subunit gpT-like protein
MTCCFVICCLPAVRQLVGERVFPFISSQKSSLSSKLKSKDSDKLKSKDIEKQETGAKAPRHSTLQELTRLESIEELQEYLHK